MSLTKNKILKYVVIGVIAVLIASLLSKNKKEEKVNILRDYSEILEDGLLKAVTEYNSISYFVNGDTISGFHYELIQAFAKAKGLKVEIVPEMSFNKRMEGLADGKYDIIAYGIPINAKLIDSICFTIPITRAKQILVQRKAEIDSAKYIRSQIQLAQKTLHVEKGSPAILRIHNMSNEIADTIYIQEVDKYAQEQLMAMVAHGDIDYAVADEDIARTAIDSFPQLDINTGISFTQFYAWGIKKQSPALCDSINAWLTEYMQTKAFKKTYSKYF
ncbi:transporter substrate-binding domain-containing protein [Bacteroides sp. 224]|uniref:transporter substrate-binding domain-containing protein n=1 Tax=Bacteroides sp. 224 TaxID=2302936 RepID=UPI0013D82BA5|nr:transporter substrate-binding domain-containing protein [Bacteroides sp. 224]NDV65878.1 glutamine ABC transporter substrate-binding protein [Bacteroides sp. 224]